MCRLTQILVFTLILLNVVISQKDKSGFQLHEIQNAESQSIKKHKINKNINEKQKFQLKGFIDSFLDIVDGFKNTIIHIFDYLILRKNMQIQKTSVIYRQNFASQSGGAQILMASSSKIKSPKAILRNDPDAYLFTADVLPITIVIGLQEQILIDSFAIQSGQVYSCITQDFMLEGAFSLQNQQWIILGNFTADYNFQIQEFAVQQKIIRYLRLTILSSYSNWKYFTLSQIKVYGQGLFSHAMQNLLQTSYKNQQNKQKVASQVSSTNQSDNNVNASEEHETKQILVQTFQKLVDDTKNVMNEKASSQQSSGFIGENETQKSDLNIQYKSSNKDKKSVNNLKKKVLYLQKRNFDLHEDLKQLRQITSERIGELEIKNLEMSTHRHHSKQHNQFLDTETIIILSLTVNVFCLILIGFILKERIFPNKNEHHNKSHQKYVQQSENNVKLCKNKRNKIEKQDDGWGQQKVNEQKLKYF